MRAFKDLTETEREVLAKYLVNNFNYQGTYLDEVELETAYDNAVNRMADGKTVRWAKTPSISAEAIFYDGEW